VEDYVEEIWRQPLSEVSPILRSVYLNPDSDDEEILGRQESSDDENFTGPGQTGDQFDLD